MLVHDKYILITKGFGIWSLKAIIFFSEAGRHSELLLLKWGKYKGADFTKIESLFIASLYALVQSLYNIPSQLHFI